MSIESNRLLRLASPESNPGDVRLRLPHMVVSNAKSVRNISNSRMIIDNYITNKLSTIYGKNSEKYIKIKKNLNNLLNEVKYKNLITENTINNLVNTKNGRNIKQIMSNIYNGLESNYNILNLESKIYNKNIENYITNKLSTKYDKNSEKYIKLKTNLNNLLKEEKYKNLITKATIDNLVNMQNGRTIKERMSYIYKELDEEYNKLVNFPGSVTQNNKE